MLNKDWMKNWTRLTMWIGMLAPLFLMATQALHAAGSSAPSIVVTATNTVTATGLGANQAAVAVDACGNIYSIESPSGVLSEIPAGGGAASVLLTGDGLNYDTNSIWMDATKSNLYVTEGPYNVYKYPITSCVLQTGSQTSFSIGNLGAVSYYWSASAVAADAAGDVFIATNVACCATPNELLEENSSSSTGTALLTSLASPISSIAVDSSNNLYFAAGKSLYELAYNAGSYAASPVLFGSGYANVVGVALDAGGNLYVTDAGASSASLLYLIPNEAGVLNPADQYIVSAGSAVNYPITLSSAVAIDASGNLYYVNGGSSVYRMTRGSMNLGSVASAATGSGTLNVTFNADVTPASISVVTGTGTFSNAATGTCAVTAYTPGNSCTVNINFMPTIPGTAYGSLVMADTGGVALATTELSGLGVGAGLTVDPGAVNVFGSGTTAPAGVAIDNQGNLFIADSSQNAVLEIPSGSSTPVTLGSGLQAPTGVAVDGAGNVYVADTGNSQIVEIPKVNGALSTAAQVVLISSSTSLAGMDLSSPAGLAVDSIGNLYIADSGNKRVVYVPYAGSLDLSLALAVGASMSSPSAVAVDGSGNAYVADAGSGDIYELTAPLSAGVQVKVASNYSNPSALAFDASGALFVCDRGNAKVWRIPNISGSLAPTSAVNVVGQINASGLQTIQAPYGVAIDPSGNLYVSDNVNAAVYMVARTSSTQSFGTWSPSSTSGDLTYFLENSGNASLTLASPFYSVTGDTTQFSLLSSESGACVSGPVAAGSDCSFEATFSPLADGYYTETYTLSSNAANATGQQIAFTGTGGITAPTTTVLAITAPSGNPSYDQAIALSVTVASSGSAGTPVGSVNLVVDGITKQTVVLNSNGVANFTIAGGALPGGSHTLSAAYLGGVANFVTFSQSSSTALQITVETVPSSTALSFTTSYANPASQTAGTALNFTATVGISPYAGVPTGTVTFVFTDASGGTPVTQSATLMPASGGAFEAVTSYMPTAPISSVDDVISAVATYSGDVNFAGSSSTAGSFDVSPAIGSVGVTPSGTAIAVSGNDSTAITFTNTSYGGWNGVVGYYCDPSTLPANAICVFSPGQVPVMPSTSGVTYPPATTTLSVLVNNPPNSPAQSSMLWWLGGLTGLLLLFVRRRMMRGAWGTITILIAAILLAGSAGGLLACNNSASFVTPVGAGTFTVVADSDPYLAGSSQQKSVPCGGVNSSGKSDPTQLPCSQQTFQVSLTVK